MGKLKTPTENWYAPDILPKAAAQTVQIFNALCTITKVRNQGPTTDAGTSTGRQHCESFSPPISCTPSLNSKLIVPPTRRCVSAVVGVPCRSHVDPARGYQNMLSPLYWVITCLLDRVRLQNLSRFLPNSHVAGLQPVASGTKTVSSGLTYPVVVARKRLLVLTKGCLC